MGMKFVRVIRDRLELTNYALAKMLGVTTQAVDLYIKEGPGRMRLDVLCALRRIARMSWSDFGKLLDDEFDKKKKE